MKGAHELLAACQTRAKIKVDLHYGIRIRHYNELYWYAMMRVSALLVTFLSRKHCIGIVFYGMNSNDVIFTAICDNRNTCCLKNPLDCWLETGQDFHPGLPNPLRHENPPLSSRDASIGIGI